VRSDTLEHIIHIVRSYTLRGMGGVLAFALSPLYLRTCAQVWARPHRNGNQGRRALVEAVVRPETKCGIAKRGSR